MRTLLPPRRGAIAALIGILIADLALTAAYFGASLVLVSRNDAGEAVVVLWGDPDELGAETKRRIAHAMTIWTNASKRPFMVCIGGSRPSRRYFGARVCAEQFAKNGVPADRIRTGRGSNDTVSNLGEVAAIAAALDVTRVAIVAHRLQAMRASLLPSPPGLTVNWSPYDLRTAQPPVGPLELWWQVHYEWLALASLMLPESLRRYFIDLMRR